MVDVEFVVFVSWSKRQEKSSIVVMVVVCEDDVRKEEERETRRRENAAARTESGPNLSPIQVGALLLSLRRPSRVMEVG